MRPQMTVEFLTYIAVSAASLALSLSLFLPYYSAMTNGEGAAQFRDFVAAIDYAMGYSSYSFTAKVPYGLCNSTLSGYGIATRYGTFPLYGNVSFSSLLCSEEGSTVRITVQRSAGGYLVG